MKYVVMFIRTLHAVRKCVMLQYHEFYIIVFKNKKIIYNIRFINASPLKTCGCATALPSLQTYGTTRPRT